MTLHDQFSTIIYMILGGIYIGIALETFRRFSPIWRHRKFLVYCLEICFWFMQTVILFYVLFLANNGELRFYVFIACLLGFSIYQAIFAPFYKKVLEYIIHLSKKLYQFCTKVIHVLMITPIKWLVMTISAIVKFALLLILNILKILILPVLWISKFIYLLLPEKIQQIINKLPQMYSIIKNTCIKWMKYIKRR